MYGQVTLRDACFCATGAVTLVPGGLHHGHLGVVRRQCLNA